MSDAAITEVAPRPAEVTWAVRLIVIALVFGLPGLVDEFHRGAADVDSTTEYYLLVVGASVAILALIAIVIFCIGRGYRWARFVYLALTVYGYLDVTGYLRASFAQGTTYGVLMILQFVCDLVALVLLFLPVSNAWFKVARAGPAR